MGEQSPIFLDKIIYLCSFYEVSNDKNFYGNNIYVKKINFNFDRSWVISLYPKHGLKSTNFTKNESPNA